MLTKRYRKAVATLLTSAALLSNLGASSFPLWQKRSSLVDSATTGPEMDWMCPIKPLHKSAFAEQVLRGMAAPWRPLESNGGSTNENQNDLVQGGPARIQHFRGAKECRNGTNGVSAGLTDRAVCPWKWEYNIDPMVIP